MNPTPASFQNQTRQSIKSPHVDRLKQMSVIPAIIITSGSAREHVAAKPARFSAINNGWQNRGVGNYGSERLKWSEFGQPDVADAGMHQREHGPESCRATSPWPRPFCGCGWCACK